MAARHRILSFIRRIPGEAWIWTGALVALACTDPRAGGLLDLCLFKAVGISFCPGCGLGHAVAFLVRGEFGASLAAHPLGFPAVVVLTARVGTLLHQARRPGGTPAAHPSFPST